MFEKYVQGLRNSLWSASYRPADAILFLTYRCTSRCSACNIWKRPVVKDEELTWDQWQPIIEDLAASKVRSIEIFGGDALLRKPLLMKMIQECTRLGIDTFFPTNASSLTQDTVRELIDAGLGTVYLSLDEVPEIGAIVRGVKRHFDRTTKAISLFRDFRGQEKTPRISCITTVSSLNYQFLHQLAQAARDAGADQYMVRAISEFTEEAVQQSEVANILPSPFFMPTDDHTHSFSAKQAKECLLMIKTLRSRCAEFAPMSINSTSFEGLNAENLVNLNYPKQRCVFATTKVVISPYGNVLPCVNYKNYHLGNLRTDSISNLWGNCQHLRFCNAQRHDEIPLCSQCSFKIYHKTLPVMIKDKFRAALG